MRKRKASKKLSALRTDEYFRVRAARGERAKSEADSKARGARKAACSG
jgi:hypothetical protein